MDRMPQFWMILCVICVLGAIDCAVDRDDGARNNENVISTALSGSQCACVDAEFCDSNVPLIDPRTDPDCGIKQVCCPPNRTKRNDDISFPKDALCTCVELDQCRASVTPKTSDQCDKKHICCEEQDRIQQNATVTEEEIIWTTEAPCRCVLPAQCQVSSIPKVTQCELQTYICCPFKDLITTSLPPPVTIPANETLTEPMNCGERNESFILSRITSTETTVFGEFPWMALILKVDVSSSAKRTKQFVCGASLLSKKIVLTSAHCTNQHMPGSLIVRAGEYNLRAKVEEETKPHQDRTALRIVQHDKYDPKTLIYDLALIEVQEPFNLDFHIAPVCIYNVNFVPPEKAVWDSSKCIATGWGKPTTDPGSTYSYTLKKAELSIVESDECQKQLRKTYLGENFTLHSSFVCAAGKDGTDTCKGDGGGPLICPLKSNPNHYVQVAITSGGVRCGEPVPGLYASLLDSYADWLYVQYHLFEAN